MNTQSQKYLRVPIIIYFNWTSEVFLFSFTDWECSVVFKEPNNND